MRASRCGAGAFRISVSVGLQSNDVMVAEACADASTRQGLHRLPGGASSRHAPLRHSVARAKGVRVAGRVRPRSPLPCVPGMLARLSYIGGRASCPSRLRCRSAGWARPASSATPGRTGPSPSPQPPTTWCGCRSCWRRQADAGQEQSSPGRASTRATNDPAAAGSRLGPPAGGHLYFHIGDQFRPRVQALVGSFNAC